MLKHILKAPIYHLSLIVLRMICHRKLSIELDQVKSLSSSSYPFNEKSEVLYLIHSFELQLFRQYAL